MRYLVLSDIHANLAAFQAVLADAGSYDQLIFLGDLANFGPDPAACVDLLGSCKAICIMGNHDADIVSDSPEHPWDQWARERLSRRQLCWMQDFLPSYILDGHILITHGVYTVPYDILPNTPDEQIEAAFRGQLVPGIDQVWFGHYHYQLDRTINGVTYRCIRPVGHHRDKDTRASYSIYENGRITHKRVAYPLDRTLAGLQKLDCFGSEETKQMFLEFFKQAFHEKLLHKDLQAMRENERIREKH